MYSNINIRIMCLHINKYTLENAWIFRNIELYYIYVKLTIKSVQYVMLVCTYIHNECKNFILRESISTTPSHIYINSYVN